MRIVGVYKSIAIIGIDMRDRPDQVVRGLVCIHNR